MLTASETVLAFIEPITDPDLVTLASIQRFLLRVTVNTTNDSLAGTRLLALLTDTDLHALLLESTFPMTIAFLSESQVAQLVSLQELLAVFEPLGDSVRVAMNESKKYLPKFTVDFINNYNTSGAPLQRITTSVFMILTANLQD